jgi:hypothetical protein
MNIDNLKAIQDELVNWGKHIVQKDNDMNPVAFVFAYHGDLDKLRKVAGPVETVESKYGFAAHKDHDLIAVARPFDMTWKEKYRVLYRALDEEQRPMIDMLIKLGKEHEVDDEYMRVCRPLMKALKMEEKDVAALAIRQMCHAIDAIAVVLVMTAWMATGPGAYERYQASTHKSLAEMDESIEVLHVTLEAQAIERIITIPLHRRPGKKRGTGKIKSWGKRVENASDLNPTFHYTGRFAKFLKPLRSKASA